jgi:hypothetical protein
MKNATKDDAAKASTHCDDYAQGSSGHPAARWFIFVHRLPYTLRALCASRFPTPTLYATLDGRRVRVVMASRLGDLGVTSRLDDESSYERRVFVNSLEDFSEKS